MGEAKRRKAAGSYPEQAPKNISGFRHTIQGGLDWRILGDLAVHPKSQALIEALKGLKQATKRTSDGKPMTVLLEAPDGTPVLEVRSLGPMIWMDLIGTFQSLGLTDRIEFSLNHSEAYDAIFQ